MQALELLVDDDTDDAVRREWSALSRAGLPSQADHTGATNAPHITLLATDELPARDEELAAALSGALPLALRLGPVVAFPGRRLVLARLVVADAALLELHSAVVTASRAVPSPLTTPGRWVPHVTLARGIPMGDLGAALSLLRAPGLDGSATRLRRWDSVAKQTSAVVG
jgi:2'-5' RNA ligase